MTATVGVTPIFTPAERRAFGYGRADARFVATVPTDLVLVAHGHLASFLTVAGHGEARCAYWSAFARGTRLMRGAVS